MAEEQKNIFFNYNEEGTKLELWVGIPPPGVGAMGASSEKICDWSLSDPELTRLIVENAKFELSSERIKQNMIEFLRREQNGPTFIEYIIVAFNFYKRMHGSISRIEALKDYLGLQCHNIQYTYSEEELLWPALCTHLTLKAY